MCWVLLRLMQLVLEVVHFQPSWMIKLVRVSEIVVLSTVLPLVVHAAVVGWTLLRSSRAVAINGITGLCITKLDVLDGMDKLKICIAYEYHDKRSEYAPLDAQGWEECTPVYLEFPGWNESTHGITSWEKLLQQPALICVRWKSWLVVRLVS